MDVLIGDRQFGKTTVLLNWFHDAPDRVLVVATVDRVEELRREVRPERRRDVLCAMELHGTLRGRQVQIAVDDADVVLQMLLGEQVQLVSVTGGEIVRLPQPEPGAVPGSNNGGDKRAADALGGVDDIAEQPLVDGAELAR